MVRYAMVFAAGLASGTIGAMGIGGGIVLIPVLTGIFASGQKEAQFINLVYFVPVALCALWVHTRAGRVLWKKALIMAAGGAVGAWAGSGVAGFADAVILKKLFGVFLLLVGIEQLLPKKNNLFRRK